MKEAFDDEGVKIPYPQRELSGRAETNGFQVAGQRERVRERDATADGGEPTDDGATDGGMEPNRRRRERMTDLAERRGTETKVYQPAEDSHLLAETAAEEIAGDELVLEVGTGSGYVSEYVAEETGARVVGADVNPHACERARERGVEAVRADLVSPFRDEAFDAVVFNPPYLPTDPDDERDDWMERALSGGESGGRSSTRSSTRSVGSSRRTVGSSSSSAVSPASRKSSRGRERTGSAPSRSATSRFRSRR